MAVGFEKFYEAIMVFLTKVNPQLAERVLQSSNQDKQRFIDKPE